MNARAQVVGISSREISIFLLETRREPSVKDAALALALLYAAALTYIHFGQRPARYSNSRPPMSREFAALAYDNRVSPTSSSTAAIPAPRPPPRRHRPGPRRALAALCARSPQTRCQPAPPRRRRACCARDGRRAGAERRRAAALEAALARARRRRHLRRLPPPHAREAASSWPPPRGTTPLAPPVTRAVTWSGSTPASTGIPAHVVGMNPHALGCYAAVRACPSTMAPPRGRRKRRASTCSSLRAQRGARHRDELQRELAPRRLCAALLAKVDALLAAGSFRWSRGFDDDGGGGGGRV